MKLEKAKTDGEFLLSSYKIDKITYKGYKNTLFINMITDIYLYIIELSRKNKQGKIRINFDYPTHGYYYILKYLLKYNYDKGIKIVKIHIKNNNGKEDRILDSLFNYDIKYYNNKIEDLLIKCLNLGDIKNLYILSLSSNASPKIKKVFMKALSKTKNKNIKKTIINDLLLNAEKMQLTFTEFTKIKNYIKQEKSFNKNELDYFNYLIKKIPDFSK